MEVLAMREVATKSLTSKPLFFEPCKLISLIFWWAFPSLETSYLSPGRTGPWEHMKPGAGVEFLCEANVETLCQVHSSLTLSWWKSWGRGRYSLGLESHRTPLRPPLDSPWGQKCRILRGLYTKNKGCKSGRGQLRMVFIQEFSFLSKSDLDQFSHDTWCLFS